MSDMKCPIKCPICGEMLQKHGEVDPDTGASMVLGANCPKCNIGNSDIKLWQELIRTRKALDVAVDALGYYASENSWDETNRWMFVENGFEFAKDVLEQITALTKGGGND